MSLDETVNVLDGFLGSFMPLVQSETRLEGGLRQFELISLNVDLC